MMAEHAVLSASSAKKWLNCTGSVAMESVMPYEESEFAKEGTVAHKLGELKIKREQNDISYVEYCKAVEGLEIDEEMQYYTENYKDFVIERYHNALQKCGYVILELEKKVDYSKYAKEGFGTSDVVIVTSGYLEIIDLKYGKGVKVEAQNNYQLMLYGLGALEAYDWLYDVNTIVMTIYQPRIDNISTFELSKSDLCQWGESIKDIAEIAYNGNGTCVAGKHCTEGFCRALPKCKTFSEYVGSIEQYQNKTIEILSNDEIAEILYKVDDLVKYAKKVKEYVLKQMLNGEEFTGYKLVEGRKSRCYSVSDSEVVAMLLQKGYTEDIVYKKELRSVADMKKVLGTDFNDILSEFVLTKRGNPTIATLEDKRPLYNSAESDFKNINVDTF